MSACKILKGASARIPVSWFFLRRNQYNAYCLADDIMEPYRPIADKLIVQIIEENGLTEDISPALKKKLLVLPALDIILLGETSPLMIAMQRTTASLARCFTGETRKIVYPTL
jgi:CRISPR-associated protein Cas1